MEERATEACRTGGESTDRVREAFSRCGVYSAMTQGVSMQPLFHTHDSTLYILPLTEEAKKYDVVLYPKRGSEEYILHRVVGVREREYLIRGDNTFILEHVPKACVLGVLSEFVRRGKHHTTAELGYRIYSRVWTAIYPLRALLHKGKLLAYALLRRLRRLWRSK